MEFDGVFLAPIRNPHLSSLRCQAAVRKAEEAYQKASLFEEPCQAVDRWTEGGE